jgi:hypothetical protein
VKVPVANVGDKFRPGEIVPTSGLYRCDGDGRHEWSTDVAGKRFPPLPCSGQYWVLRIKRP